MINRVDRAIPVAASLSEMCRHSSPTVYLPQLKTFLCRVCFFHKVPFPIPYIFTTSSSSSSSSSGSENFRQHRT